MHARQDVCWPVTWARDVACKVGDRSTTRHGHIDVNGLGDKNIRRASPTRQPSCRHPSLTHFSSHTSHVDKIVFVRVAMHARQIYGTAVLYHKVYRNRRQMRNKDLETWKSRKGIEATVEIWHDLQLRIRCFLKNVFWLEKKWQYELCNCRLRES